MRPILPALIALPLLLATPAAAAPEDVTAFRLEYEVPPGVVGCPKEPDFADLVSARFGHDLFPEGARATLVVKIKHAKGRLDAELEARDEQGKTQWKETATPLPKCEALVQEIASLIFARFVVPMGEHGEPWTLLLPSGAPPPPPPAAPPPPPPTPAASTAPSPTPTTPPPDPLPFRREVSAAFVTGIFDTPHVAFGGAFQVTLRWPWASLGAELRVVVDHRGEVEDVAIRTWLVTGVALPCLIFGERGRACLPLSGGFYQASIGDRLKEVDRDVTQAFAAAGVRGAYDWPVAEKLSLRAYGEVLFAARRARWGYAPTSSTVWITPGVLPSVGIGIVWEP